MFFHPSSYWLITQCSFGSCISTALLRGCDLLGRAKSYDMAVLEVDERSSVRVYPYITPDYIAVTNLFRDSIMRNAHAEFIADIISRSVPASSRLVLNADDLISCGLAPENPRVYFGIDRLPSDTVECVNHINDVRICPKCAGKLRYEYRRYHHIGHAVCPACGRLDLVDEVALVVGLEKFHFHAHLGAAQLEVIQQAVIIQLTGHARLGEVHHVEVGAVND